MKWMISQSEFTTITYLGDDYSSKRGTKYENLHILLFCLSHPLTLHTCKANQQTHGPTALSPGGIEKLLKLWNNIVNWKKLDQLPSFLWWHTHLIPLSITHPSPDTSRLITWYEVFAAIVVVRQCAHTYSMCEPTICHAEEINLRSCHKPSTLNPQYFYYLGSQMLSRQQCCQICLWLGWTSNLQIFRKEKKRKKPSNFIEDD